MQTLMTMPKHTEQKAVERMPTRINRIVPSNRTLPNSSYAMIIAERERVCNRKKIEARLTAQPRRRCGGWLGKAAGQTRTQNNESSNGTPGPQAQWTGRYTDPQSLWNTSPTSQSHPPTSGTCFLEALDYFFGDLQPLWTKIQCTFFCLFWQQEPRGRDSLGAPG